MKMDERILKATQANFDRLPALVSRQEFIDWTGLSSKELSAEVAAGTVKVYRPKGKKYGKYYKMEIARMGGFRM